MRTGHLALLLACAPFFGAKADSGTTVSGPYTHENLAIYLIHGGAGVSTHYLTLQRAMEQKKVTVYETSQTNDLAVENTSVEPVFLQAGDIVRGGGQDRMISNDFVLPPKSGRLPLSVFCVEQGRSGPRGDEPARTFTAPTELGAVRFAPKSAWTQASIWASVSSLQQTLSSVLRGRSTANSAGVAALAPASPTSLLLTQISPAVENATGDYLAKLSAITARKEDITGYVFAVSGEVKGADVYSSPALFSAMWPKLLKSSAIEALRLRGRQAGVAPKLSQAESFLHEADAGRQTTQNVDPRNKLVKRETDRQSLVELWTEGRWVHRNVVKKETR